MEISLQQWIGLGCIIMAMAFQGGKIAGLQSKIDAQSESLDLFAKTNAMLRDWIYEL